MGGIVVNAYRLNALHCSPSTLSVQDPPYIDQRRATSQRALLPHGHSIRMRSEGLGSLFRKT